MQSILKPLKGAVLLSIMLLVLCGFLYPLAVTGVGQLIFPHQANGSIIEENGVAIGSELEGQAFTDARFFKGRPSAYNYNTYTKEDTIPDENGDVAYGGVSSGSQNMAASNPALVDRVKADIEAFLAANPGVKKEDIPTDLMTASGSGLDPHISPASAEIQIPAIAKASGLSESELKKIVENNTSGKVLGVYGQDKVNVLMSNLEIAKELGIIPQK